MINTQSKFISKFAGRIHNIAKKKEWDSNNKYWIYDESIWNFISANGITLDDCKEALRLKFIDNNSYLFLKCAWGHNVSSRQIVLIEDILKTVERSKL